MRQRALAEGLHDARDFLLGDAGPGIADAEDLAAVARQRMKTLLKL